MERNIIQVIEDYFCHTSYFMYANTYIKIFQKHILKHFLKQVYYYVSFRYAVYVLIISKNIFYNLIIK